MTRRGDDEGDQTVVAAGAVVWRPQTALGGAIEICLVHRPRYDDWSLPKGKQDPGEHILACA
ncbi:MAG TPA: NUDIX domain-containing protein, partial [Jiangellaceae bacterium]|nr:NUDIX domain-containing protein [Jiangellaceae bacterium]